MLSISIIKKVDEPLVADYRSHLHESAARDVFVPGEKISADLTGYMRGHGTHTAQQAMSFMEVDGSDPPKAETTEDPKQSKPGFSVQNTELRASLGGRLRRVNKLLTVEAPRFRYVGHVGDCVVGRVVALGQKRWLIDTNSRLLSILLLSAVNLPGGEQRRKSEEDERAMRAWLREGDIVSAEVQTVYHDGSLALHTRSLRYGKVGAPPSEGGVMLTVPPALVRRSKTHFHTLPCGTNFIIGNNGIVWVEPANVKNKPGHDEHSSGILVSKSDDNIHDALVVSREAAARVKNCILAMAAAGLPLFSTSIVAAVEFSQARCSSASELLIPSVAQEMTENLAGQLARGIF